MTIQICLNLMDKVHPLGTPLHRVKPHHLSGGEVTERHITKTPALQAEEKQEL